MDLERCQIFTPTKMVEYMLDLIDYKHGIFGKKIIDNACGDGNFLTEIVNRFIQDGIDQGIPQNIIKIKLEKCIMGCDIDEKLVIQCRDRLNETAQQFGLKSVHWNVSCSDGLEYSEKCRFDFVVGNPPYIAYMNLDERVRLSTKEKFLSCKKGKFDYSYAFIEKGLRMLKKNGHMVMITPSNIFRTVFGHELRELIKPYLVKVIDVSAEKIFTKVLTAPAITLYKKGKETENIVYIEWQKNTPPVQSIVAKRDLQDKWTFNESEMEGMRRFGDYFKVSNGVATLANKIFVHDQEDDIWVKYQVEKGILRPAASPKALCHKKKQVIIFPYYYLDSKLYRYSFEELNMRFPNAVKYLKQYIEPLRRRDSDKNAAWFEYGRSQALAHLDCEKLLLSTIITSHVSVYKIDRNVIPYTGIYITSKKELSLQKAKQILCTDTFFCYAKKRGIKLNGSSFRITTKDIEEFRF